MKANNINTLVLSGGGITGGIALGSAIYELCNRKKLYLSNISNIRGTSAGALVGLYIACGLSERVIYKSISTNPINKIGGLFAPSLWKTFGLADDNEIRNFLSKELKENGVNPQLKFSDLKKHFTVFATDLPRNKEIVMNNDLTPDVSVLDAVIASAAFPILLPPQQITINGVLYTLIDGGIFCNFGIDHSKLAKLDPKSTLGIYIERETKEYYSEEFKLNILTYLSTLILTIIERLNENQKNWSTEYAVLKLLVPQTDPWVNTDSLTSKIIKDSENITKDFKEIISSSNTESVAVQTDL